MKHRDPVKYNLIPQDSSSGSGRHRGISVIVSNVTINFTFQGGSVSGVVGKELKSLIG